MYVVSHNIYDMTNLTDYSGNTRYNALYPTGYLCNIIIIIVLIRGGSLVVYIKRYCINPF